MDGNEILSKTQDRLKVEIKNCMIRPSVAVIQIGDNPAGDKFVSIKEKACSVVGIYFRLYKFEDGTPELTVINKIKELNNDEYVNGIMIQLPIPAKYNEKRLLNSISNGKDVDGMTDINAGRFVNGKKSLIPCTALAVSKLLDENNIEVSGKNVVVVGRSKIAGRPISNLLLSKDATVTICHSKTVNLANYTKQADIVVMACGVPKLLTGDMIKDDAVVIDVGFTEVNDEVMGDVDFETVEKKASYITPVPGGVGPVTVAMLLENIYMCYSAKNSK